MDVLYVATSSRYIPLGKATLKWDDLVISHDMIVSNVSESL